METLQTIFKGHVHGLAKEVRYLVLNRACACDRCPHKRQRTPGGKLFGSPINDPKNTYVCRIAGNPLLNLLSDPGSRCPAAVPHWQAIHATI